MESIIFQLLQACNFQVDLAQMGIVSDFCRLAVRAQGAWGAGLLSSCGLRTSRFQVFIDEIDKVAKKGADGFTGHRDVSGEVRRAPAACGLRCWGAAAAMS